MSSGKVTVKDIARLAGVSIGTVDRVMHNRGGVAAESRRKIIEAMDTLGYVLNTNASILANKKHYRICCLLPESRTGDYWELVRNGVERARKDAAGYNITIDTISYDQFSRESFVDAVEVLKADLPQAVLMAPMYHAETVSLAAFLHSAGVPLVFIDSKVDEADYLAYYGIPMFESGYLAASLLLDDCHTDEIVNFRIERGAAPIDNPTLMRRKGFLDYVAERNPQLKIYNEFLRPYDKAYNRTVLDGFFGGHPDIRYVVMFNSRVHLVTDYLAERGARGMTVVGFDLLRNNVDALRGGVVKYLIVQRTEMQVRRGVNALADYLAFGKRPTSRDNYMPMDILVRENIDFYSEIYKD